MIAGSTARRAPRSARRSRPRPPRPLPLRTPRGRPVPRHRCGSRAPVRSQPALPFVLAEVGAGGLPRAGASVVGVVCAGRYPMTPPGVIRSSPPSRSTTTGCWPTRTSRGAIGVSGHRPGRCAHSSAARGASRRSAFPARCGCARCPQPHRPRPRPQHRPCPRPRRYRRRRCRRYPVAASGSWRPGSSSRRFTSSSTSSPRRSPSCIAWSRTQSALLGALALLYTFVAFGVGVDECDTPHGPGRLVQVAPSEGFPCRGCVVTRRHMRSTDRLRKRSKPL